MGWVTRNSVLRKLNEFFETLPLQAFSGWSFQRDWVKHALSTAKEPRCFRVIVNHITEN